MNVLCFVVFERKKPFPLKMTRQWINIASRFLMIDEFRNFNLMFYSNSQNCSNGLKRSKMSHFNRMLQICSKRITIRSKMQQKCSFLFLPTLVVAHSMTEGFCRIFDLSALKRDSLKNIWLLRAVEIIIFGCAKDVLEDWELVFVTYIICDSIHVALVLGVVFSPCTHVSLT